MGDISPREFGEMAANVATLLEHQKEIRTDLAKQEGIVRSELTTATGVLFAKIDNLQTAIEAVKIGPCAVGKQHEKDVLELKLMYKKLEERPARIVGLGVLILTGLGIIAGFILWVHSKLTSVVAIASQKWGCG